MKLIFTYKGGKGSGNFGHSGRPGKVGGSASGSGGRASATLVREMEGARRRNTKITIQQAAGKLEAAGYKLGRPRFDHSRKVTNYKITKPDGETVEVSSDAIKMLLETL